MSSCRLPLPRPFYQLPSPFHFTLLSWTCPHLPLPVLYPIIVWYQIQFPWHDWVLRNIRVMLWPSASNILRAWVTACKVASMPWVLFGLLKHLPSSTLVRLATFLFLFFSKFPNFGHISSLRALAAPVPLLASIASIATMHCVCDDLMNHYLPSIDVSPNQRLGLLLLTTECPTSIPPGM